MEWYEPHLFGELAKPKKQAPFGEVVIRRPPEFTDTQWHQFLTDVNDDYIPIGVSFGADVRVNVGGADDRYTWGAWSEFRRAVKQAFRGSDVDEVTE